MNTEWVMKGFPIISMFSHLFWFLTFYLPTETAVMYGQSPAQRASPSETSQIPGPQDVGHRHDGESTNPKNTIMITVSKKQASLYTWSELAVSVSPSTYSVKAPESAPLRPNSSSLPMWPWPSLWSDTMSWLQHNSVNLMMHCSGALILLWRKYWRIRQGTELVGLL